MLDRDTIHGSYFALSAYIFWGVAPIYFKWIDHVPPFEILSHRVIWALILVLAILAYTGELSKIIVPRKMFPTLLLTAVLLSINWLVFIYAVVNSNIVETSLGYFINPLVSVLLGVFFLKESLRPLQWFAIGITAAGILVQLIAFGEIPWLGLALAFSFGFYGLVRKNINLHPIAGLTIETMIVAPFGLCFIFWLYSQGAHTFGQVSIRTDLLLMLGGFVTSFPLLCFAAAVTRLSLTTMGMFQYIAPTMSLIIAVLIYGESFGLSRIILFTCIWTALIIFTGEAWYFHNRLKKRGLIGAD